MLYRAQVDGADDDAPSNPSRFAAAFGLPLGRLSGGFNGRGSVTGASGVRSGNEGGPASPPPRTLSNLSSGLQVGSVVVFTTLRIWS